jgi:dihydroxy-acid dehydratase
VNKGLVVNEVSPEGATGGPLALVEDGDRIVIDVDERRLDLDVPEDELQARRARWVAPPARHIPGWLGVYEQTVSSLSKGAVLGRG